MTIAFVFVHVYSPVFRMYASLDDLKLEMEVEGDTAVQPSSISKDAPEATPEIGEFFGLLVFVSLHAH